MEDFLAKVEISLFISIVLTDLNGLRKMDNYSYPIGADTPDAPWNQADNPEREIEVTVSVTLSKTVKVKVSDYAITDSGKDEDGEYFEDIDYSKCDLKRVVEEQITLPQDAYKYVKGEFDNDQYNDLKGWCVDDFEIVLD